MPLYLFHIYREDGAPRGFESRELPYDSAAFPAAGDLLAEHSSAAYVAVWEGERPVLERHRDSPRLRPLSSASPGPAP